MNEPTTCFWCDHPLNSEGICSHCASDLRILDK